MQKLSQSTYKKLHNPNSIWESIKNNTGCNAKTLAFSQLNSDNPIKEYVMELERAILEKSKMPMLLGLRFEQLLIGAGRGGNDEEIILPTNKNGTKKAAVKRMEEAAQMARELLKKEEISFHTIQPDWNTKYWTGHPDCLGIVEGHEVIADIKYSEIKKQKKGELPPKADYFYNPYHPWHEGLKMQACTYTTMYYLKHGEILPFYFLIFRPYATENVEIVNEKTGEIKEKEVTFYMLDMRKIDFSLERNAKMLENHANEMSEVGKMFASGEYPSTKNPSPENCVDCPFKCSMRNYGVDKSDMDILI